MIAVTKFEERVNLRLTSEVFKPYARLAELMGVTVTEVMRDALTENIEVVEMLIAMAERAQAGDKQGVTTLTRSMFRYYRSYLDHQEILMLPEDPAPPAENAPQS